MHQTVYIKQISVYWCMLKKLKIILLTIYKEVIILIISGEMEEWVGQCTEDDGDDVIK